MRVLRSSLPVMQAWSKFREKADYSIILTIMKGQDL